MDSQRKAIVMAARSEVERMRAAIDAAPDRMQVTMPTEKFTYLAKLLDGLADAVTFWQDEAFDDPRYWVPLGHFQQVKAEAERWQGEYGRLTDRQSFDELLRF